MTLLAVENLRTVLDAPEGSVRAGRRASCSSMSASSPIASGSGSLPLPV